MLTQFDAFLIVFFLMCAAIALIAVAGIIDSYMYQDEEAVAYDTAAQDNLTKGVKL